VRSTTGTPPTFSKTIVNCDGNCGTNIIPDDRVDGYYTVLTPHNEELNFCSPACIDSWLAMEGD
jgi:hypothetical protein